MCVWYVSDHVVCIRLQRIVCHNEIRNTYKCAYKPRPLTLSKEVNLGSPSNDTSPQLTMESFFKFVYDSVSPEI